MKVILKQSQKVVLNNIQWQYEYTVLRYKGKDTEIMPGNVRH